MTTLMSGRPSRSRAGVGALALALVALVLPSGVLAAPPVNDAFVDRIVIPFGDLPFEDEVDHVDEATTEPGEPLPCGFAGRTAWYRITPTSTTYLDASVTGEDNSEPAIAVFRGPSLEDLELVGCGDLSESGSVTRVVWRAGKDVRYYLQVDASGSDRAFLRVRKAKPPANDDIASAKQVTSLPLVHVTDLMNATWQAGEPDPTQQPADFACVDDRHGRTIWYSYRADRTRTVRVDTFLSGVDTWVSVHRGSALGGLTLVACNDDITEVGSGRQSSITWKAVAGRSYRIQVGGALGHDELAVRFRQVTPPANDDFADASVLPPDGSVRVVDTRTATTQAGEPFPDGSRNPGASVWYRFTPAESGTYGVDTQGSADLDLYVAIWRGSALSELTFIKRGCCPRYEPIEFDATEGEPYRIQVFGAEHDAGRVHVHLRRIDP